ncbi:MAG: hypothetical protein IPM39_09470 [Chloroflexi bacterium]|nr:hypothetical protein [Chloroflexota bacterium]
MIATLVESLGSLEALIASLLGKYGAEEIPFVLFEGSPKAQILALHSANFGSDQPDMMGVAHSFRQALLAGATPEEIARNCGQHIHYVRNHLALTDIPPDLAQRIAAGELPMSVATAVADLPEPKRTGLAIFILANEPGKLTAKAIKECAATLKKWPGLQLPLMVKHQSQRNIARALVQLWGQALAAYPEDAYAAAAMFIFRDVHEEPWSKQEKLALWFQALGGETYFANGQIHWSEVVQYLITEVSCATCPIGQLPRQSLRDDLSQGQGGPLGMPCRVGEEGERCLHGLAPNDNFDVRVPWAWGQHPGVVGEGGDYRVKSYDDLLQAWQTQAAKERELELEREREREREEEGSGAMVGSSGSTVDAKPKPEKGQRPLADTGQPFTGSPAPTPPPSDSPIAKQRARIADFMARHGQMAVSHPFATACGDCRHKLEASPTKDESVPHCAWAGRSRQVAFKVLAADDKNAPQIPVCRQFAPNRPWTELIPAHPAPPEIPRAWLKEQLLHLVQAANRHGSERNAFEFLTGRPLAASESHSDWFSQQLATQGGELSDAQLFTLFIWAHAEWQRAQGQLFSLPLNGSAAQFAAYQERPFS